MPEQAVRLAEALASVPEEPGPDRLCQTCHERPVNYRGLGICRRCYLRKERGSIPRYDGRCQWLGCPKDGRGRSGYCRGHYQQGWHQEHRWKTVLARQLGTSLTVEEVAQGLAEATGSTPLSQQSLVVMRSLVEQLRLRHLTLAKSPWPGRRG